MAAKRLIVGLGNPGAEYEGTRHNIGFAVVDALAEREGIRLSREPGNVFAGRGSLRGRAVELAKPQTFMNRSGSAVQALLGRLGLKPDAMLVVFDDLNLPVGTVRIRQQGSAGGHNGVQDIIDRLGTDAFPRLRIGIGNSYPRGRQADFVLSPFSQPERLVMEEALLQAVDAAGAFVIDGLIAAMNRFNRTTMPE